MATQLMLSPGDEPDERWLPVVGYDGWYDVSDRGRMRSWRRYRERRRDRPKVLKLTDQNGYPATMLTAPDGSIRHVYAHRAVLEAFVGPCPEGMLCRHLDGDESNAALFGRDGRQRLAWGTQLENIDDALRHGAVPTARVLDHEPILFADPFIPIEALIPWEVWSEIRLDRCEGFEVSSFGRVRSWCVKGHAGKWRPIPLILKPRRCYRETTHLAVTIRMRRFKVHRLVIEAFSPRPADGVECRHVDGDAADNHVRNLRWGTRLENVRDMLHHGTHHAPASNLTDAQILEILDRLATREKGARLAEEYGVSPGKVSNLYRGRIRRDITLVGGKSLCERLRDATARQ